MSDDAMGQRSLMLFAVELAMALWAEAFKQTEVAQQKCLAWGLLKPSRKWCWNMATEALYSAQMPRVEAGANMGIGIVRGQPVHWRRVL